MIKILHHGNCPDGTGAALAAYLHYGDTAQYIPVQYGKEPPDMKDGTLVYILDFSYPRKTLLRMQETMDVVVLDHHKTAEKELEGLLGCKFDMNKSGSVMAWECFHAGEPLPWFFAYLQDRDLWRFELPDSREVSAAIGSYPLTIESFHRLYTESTYDSMVATGKACLRLKDQQVGNMCKQQRVARFNHDRTIDLVSEPHFIASGQFGEVVGGWQAPVANATAFFSEVGEKLLEQNPEAKFAAYYFDRKDGVRQWGLRSRKDFDCSVVAKQFGGGGHAQASGFQELL